MKSKVAIAKCVNYSALEINSAIERLFADLGGGIDNWVKPGQKVLIKPNILSNLNPDTHVVTHPEVVKAVALKVKKAGAEVWIGDSPGIGTLKTVSIKSGIKKIAEELNVELKEFDERIPLKSPQGYMINIAKAVIEADVIINIPKVKTHTQMLLTLGVKNCFGCIPGSDKARWHFRAGINEEKFAQILVNTYLLVKPTLTIADGVIGLEGDGPGTGGRPRPLGWLVASSDAVALDRIIVELLQVNHLRLATLAQARKAEAGNTELKDIEVVGDSLDHLKVSGFVLPARLQSLQFERLPVFVRKYFRNMLTSRPVLRKESCVSCGKCYKACPVQAIKWEKGQFPDFDYTQCIRCFCCQEMCQDNAIGVRDGYGLKILQPFRDMLLKKYGI